MTSIEALNELADETPDSRNTYPGDTMYFCGCSTIGESLKKLKNHNFTFGYAFDIEVNGQIFTRITAYNQKNDIVLAWMGPDQSSEVKFPCRHHSYQSFLYLIRYQDSKQNKIKIAKERLTSKLCDGKKQIESDIPHIVHLNQLEWFGNYWPILEHPEIERQKRMRIFERSQIQSCDRTFYQGVATLCNIYKFDETYEKLDPGLQKIYLTLFENREAIFCREVENRSIVNGTIIEMLSMLNMDYNQLVKIFERQGLKPPALDNNEFAEIDQKISFIRDFVSSIKQSVGGIIGGKQRTKMPNETPYHKLSS